MYGDPIDKAPEEGVEGTEFLLDLQYGAGIGDRGRDLEAVADDAAILQQAFALGRAIGGDRGDIEVGVSATVVFPFLQDRQPAQTRLCSFEDEHLEEALVVVEG